MTFLAILWLGVIPSWIIAAAIGLFVGWVIEDSKYHRFFARMMLLTPIWPVVAVIVVPKMVIRSILWLIRVSFRADT